MSAPRLCVQCPAGATFWQDSFSIPGTIPGTTTASSLGVSSYKWIAALPYVQTPNPNMTAFQGLVGFAPPGGGEYRTITIFIARSACHVPLAVALVSTSVPVARGATNREVHVQTL